MCLSILQALHTVWSCACLYDMLCILPGIVRVLFTCFTYCQELCLSILQALHIVWSYACLYDVLCILPGIVRVLFTCFAYCQELCLSNLHALHATRNCSCLFYMLYILPGIVPVLSFKLVVWLLVSKWYRRVLNVWFGQDQSTVAQRTETTVIECFLTSCVWARFRIGSHTMPEQRHSQPTPTSLGQKCMHV